MKQPSPIAWVWKKRLGAKSLIVGVLNENHYSRYNHDYKDTHKGIAVEIAILLFAVGGYIFLKLYN